MLELLFWIAIGAFIGWNFPQPWYAKVIQEKAIVLLDKVRGPRDAG